MILKIYPSNEQFSEVYFLADWIAKLKNAHLFYDLKDISKIDITVDIIEMEKLFEELIH